MKLIKEYWRLDIHTRKMQRQKFYENHFEVVCIPYDEDGMPADAAIYLVNKWNSGDALSWKYWIDQEDLK